MKRRTTYLLGAIVLAVGVLAVLASRPDPVPVETATAARGLVTESVTNTRAGTIKACQRARLAPPSGGQIAKLPVRKGDRVQAGQVLLELWNDDIRAELSLAERDAVAARARADEACVAATVARRESDRLAALVERSLVSIETAERAEGEADSREAACRAARQNIKVAEARIEQAKAAMERTLLRAPFDGIVAEINGEIGEFVTPSPVGIPTPPAVDVVDTSCIYVAAPIDEVDAPRIREGMPARVSLDAFRDRVFAAHVRRVAPYVLDVEKQARTVEIEAELQGIESATLLPGYSADIEVILQERPEVLRIPTRALIDGKRVFVYDPADGRVHVRDVQVGLRNWEFVEITSGLQEGDAVVTTVDREGLIDGARASVSATANRS
jgi:HlyD family secretion protein